jgi:hypothetical protein
MLRKYINKLSFRYIDLITLSVVIVLTTFGTCKNESSGTVFLSSERIIFGPAAFFKCQRVYIVSSTPIIVIGLIRFLSVVPTDIGTIFLIISIHIGE